MTWATTGGPEAAARAARYAALSAHRGRCRCCWRHTLDDQAETVLLGLGRGSGARSIAGMRPYDPPWCRPLLGVRRAVTHAACAELGLTPWQDPHNTDRRFTRVRLRTEVLPLLEDVLGGGVAEALARTATALREDTELLDALAGAGAARGRRRAPGCDARALAALPDAVRRRVIRGWLLAGGATGLTDKQIRGVDALVTALARAGRGGGRVAAARRAAVRGAPRRRADAAARAGVSQTEVGLPLVVRPLAWHAVGVAQISSAITPAQPELYPGTSSRCCSPRSRSRRAPPNSASRSAADYRDVAAETARICC